MRPFMVCLGLLLGACAGGASTGEGDIDVIAEGLLNPIGLQVLPSGDLLVAEEGTGQDDTSAGVSLVSNGRVDRVVSGLPSGRDSGDLAGVPMVGVSPDGEMAYTAHFGSGSLLTFPTPSSSTVASGVIFGPEDLERDMVPLNRVELVNPFDITFTEDGTPVVTDASENGVATRNPDGSTRFIHRFADIPAPGNPSLRIDAVPTGITRVGPEFYVTLTGGCPYPEGSGRLVAIDGDRGERTVVDGLNMPIDVAVGGDGTIWLLEFARFDPDASCLTGEGYRAGTGRLSRVVGDRIEPVVEGLDFPGSVAVGPDGSVYLTEVFAGRVLKLRPAGEADAAAPNVASPWRLTDVAGEVGLDFNHGAFRVGVSPDPVAMMGGGLCWIDIDADGLLDLYVVNSHALEEVDYWMERGGLPRNRLYRNTGDGFQDVTEGSGTGLAHRGMGCVAADLDGDGDSDLYVTADGPDTLLINDGDGRFSELPAPAGTSGWSSAAAVADVDGDGSPDLFVASYIDLERRIDKPSGAFPQDYLGVMNHLYLNDGTGRFTEVTSAVGLEDEDRTLGAVFTDVDRDGDLDLYVANDGQPNRLYENRPTVQPPGFELVDVTRDAGVGDSGSGMGIAPGDYDADGSSDLFVTNWEAELHALYRNETDGSRPVFGYRTYRVGFSGLGEGETGWGTAFADLDNDTDLDLIVVNGRVPMDGTDRDRERLKLFGNLQAEGTPGEIRDWSRRVGLGQLEPLTGRGGAVADFDNDGDLDVAINQIGGPLVLLRNDGGLPAWLRVEVVPAEPGTLVTVRAGDLTMVRELHAGSSYLSSEDPRAHFGLGTLEAPVEVEVVWPDGTEIHRSGVQPGEAIRLVRP